MPSFCSKCGSPLNPVAKFCTVCGAPAPRPAPAPASEPQAVSAPETSPAAVKPSPAAPKRETPRVCPNCGEVLKPGVAFCTACGARAAVPASAVPASVSAAPEPVPETPARPAFTPDPVRPEPWMTGATTLVGAAVTDGLSGETGGAIFDDLTGPARRGPVCPGCGRAVQPGQFVCPICGTPLTAAAAAEPPDEEETEIRETKRRTGLWIAISAAAALLLAGAILLIVFWPDWFGKKDESTTYGTETVEPTKDRPGLSETEESQVPTDVTAPSEEVTYPAEVTTTPPPETYSHAKYSVQDAEWIVHYNYGGDAKLLTETDEKFTVGVYRPGTDVLCGIVDVDKATGECTVVQPVNLEPDAPAPSDPGATEMPRFYGNTDPELGPTEASNLSHISFDDIADLMNDNAPGADYALTVLDLYSGERAGNDRMKEGMSSSVLIGIPVIYALNHELEAGELTMDTVLPVVSGMSARGSLSGVESMTVRDLLTAVLRDSSGDAICTLMDAIGWDRISEICDDAGYESVRINNYIGRTVDNDEYADNFVSTADLCGMFLELYCGQDTAEINRAYLLEHFGVTADEHESNGLGKYLEGVVGSFNGLKSDKFNEILLVERDGRAYVIAMLANGAPYGDIQDAMAQIGYYLDAMLA